MLFNSLQYLVFFWVVAAAYWSVPHRFRWPLLVVASCYFYMALVPAYILILFAVILVDWGAGLWIGRSAGWTRKLALWTSLVANVGLLAVFKYWHFFHDVSEDFARLLGRAHTPMPALSLLLPIGLSFHTFQSMSYTIEVYWRRQVPERHLGIYALYVLFFPQMVAGPIERPQHVLHQLREPKLFRVDQFASGLRLIVWGLFKKSVLADNLAHLADAAWTDPQARGWPLVLAAVAFSFQILCDFWGYTDMARGSARCLGIDLMRNFDSPYSSLSLGEFWRRWHISLSTWFRDYLYIPLGGSRVAPLRRDFNLFVVFTVSGFWHGADWAFIAWGALHGGLLVVENRLGLGRGRNLPWLRRLVVFAVVTLAWVFFRAGTTGALVSWVVRLGQSSRGWNLPISGWHILMPVGLGLVAWVESLRSRGLVERWLAQPPALRAVLAAIFVFAILTFGRFDARNFIYFQF
jgi:D-alanyl-lipoteichoic acid acyltransferase DltB (MBOAT superfamily)